MSSLFKACTTHLNHVIQPTHAFSPEAVLRLLTQPRINLAYSSAALGNFYREKETIQLFRLQLDMMVSVCMRAWCVPGVSIPWIKNEHLVKIQGSFLLDRIPEVSEAEVSS